MSVKCPGCAGNLLFSPSRQAMYCRMCGNTYAPEEVGSEDHASPTYECNIYRCSSCGGEIAVTGSEASSVCLFCGSPSLIFDRISERMRPDGVLPFQITRDQARENIEQHLKGGRFIPSAISNVKEDNIRGIYLPYRVLSGEIYDAAVISSTIGSGKNSRTVLEGMAGYAEFRNVPLDASVSLNDEYGRKIEPFYYDDVKDFDEDYLSGFYSDIQDATDDEMKSAATLRCDKMFCDKCKEIATGHDAKTYQSVPSVRLTDKGVYLLLPCWFYTFVYDGQPYTLLVNGQTGKTAGTIPWDKGRVKKISIALFLGLVLLWSIPFFFGDKELNNIVGSFYVHFLGAFGAMFIFIGCMMMRSIKKELAMTRDKRVFRFVKERQG